MTDQDRHELLDLVLAYEDLGEAQRRRIDEILAGDEQLRRQWQRIREIERAALGPLPESEGDFWAVETLPPDAEAAARDSYAQLREALRRAPEQPAIPLGTVRSETPWWRRWQKGGRLLLVPAAAVLALLLLLPLRHAEKTLLQDLSVVSVQLAPTADRSGDVSATGVLTSGQAFALRFFLEDDAYVVIYHVDPVGAMDLVFPASVDRTPPRLLGNRNHSIPDAASGENWILGVETGQETFIVGASSDWRPDFGELLPSLTSGMPAQTDREKTVAELQARLKARMPHVQRIDLSHVE
jgi:hypothetical protein